MQLRHTPLRQLVQNVRKIGFNRSTIANVVLWKLKDKKEAAGAAAMKPRTSRSVMGKGPTESPRDEFVTTMPGNGQGIGSGSSSASSSGSGSSPFDKGNDTTTAERYCGSSRTIMECRVIACIKAQLGEPLIEDGPILGMEFNELPLGAFGTPIESTNKPGGNRNSYDNKLHGRYDGKHMKVSSISPHETLESKIWTDTYGHVTPSSMYGSPITGAQMNLCYLCMQMGIFPLNMA